MRGRSLLGYSHPLGTENEGLGCLADRLLKFESALSPTSDHPGQLKGREQAFRSQFLSLSWRRPSWRLKMLGRGEVELARSRWVGGGREKSVDAKPGVTGSPGKKAAWK